MWKELTEREDRMVSKFESFVDEELRGANDLKTLWLELLLLQNDVLKHWGLLFGIIVTLKLFGLLRDYFLV